MAKPWSRYEVDFINHEKFRAIHANAICLWIEGKNYADKNLTDGLLPAYEVKHWRFYSKKAVETLTTSIGTNTRTGQQFAPLWEVHPVGWKMHDYLGHNECREEVQARIAVGNGTATEDQKRIAAAARQRRKRERDKAVRVCVTA